ncbi:hypothetical protein [Helicobacter sp. 11S02596-1]|uniref:putative barnase/colicin E5 family endoribonuclease n=1 Tax=Helicobacter sp. 11S02596-1 TaxID=1476194 RepID=UPI000BA78200|nr:hypothetical protein [Helicobacter sp. 11S02596-1]PAF43616.1 hypothetical protein BJI48_05010 [Helicobacter sp. 11S02596-1]
MDKNLYVGTDFTQEFYHQDQLAVQKLLMEKQGFIKGAFYRSDIGDIDLVWGNDDFGLCHILKQRSKQFGEVKALKFISHLEENIKNGVAIAMRRDRIGIITNQSSIVLEKSQSNHFILTAYIDRKNKLRLENFQTIHDGNFIDESGSALNKGDDVLSSNQSQDNTITKSPTKQTE